MPNLRSHFFAVIGTVVVFIGSLWVNEVIFAHSQFVRGVNWVYLPSGVRLLSTLLLGGDGAIGLLVASLLVDFFYFFPHDPVRAFAGGIIGAVAPYAVYRLAREWYGLHASLSNLTPRRLLILAMAFSLANPLLHHAWFFLQGDTQNFAERFFAMFVGDLSGAVIMLYVAKGAISLIPQGRHLRRARRAPSLHNQERRDPPLKH